MLLEKVLAEYLLIVEAAIIALEDAYIERYEEEVLAPDRINLRVRVRFNSRDLLEINEAVVVENAHLKHLGYRYHFQDKKNKQNHAPLRQYNQNRPGYNSGHPSHLPARLSGQQLGPTRQRP